MDALVRALQYTAARPEELLDALGRHLLLVGVALGIGCLVCVPLGVLTSRSRAASAVFMNAFSAMRVIPSLAILFLALPYFGLTLTSALVALTVLALPPILINSDTAFRTIDPAVREAAFGMGMTKGQVLRRVELPLAIPTIVAGIKTAAVEVISSATLAAFIGGGGLGVFIVRGFGLYDTAILLVGAVPVALLAITAELSLGAIERALRPPVRR